MSGKSFAYDIPEDVDSMNATRKITDGKYIVFFRPLPSWKGIGYGFDFIPDNFFLNEKEVQMGKLYKKGKKGKKELVMNPNDYEGDLKDGDKMLKELLNNEYKSMTIVDSAYFISPFMNYAPWLSLYPQKGTKKAIKYKKIDVKSSISPVFSQMGEEAYESSVDVQYTENTKAELNVTIFGTGVPDYFAFEPNEHFKITADKLLVIKDKKALQSEIITLASQPQVSKRFKKWDNLKVTIECLTEFDTDQELVLNAYFKESGGIRNVKVGSIWVWANMRCKTAKVVFIEVKTPPMSNIQNLEGVAPINISGINNYLRQALIELELVETVKLDLKDAPELLPGGIYRDDDRINYKISKEKTMFDDLKELFTNSKEERKYFDEYLNSKIDTKYEQYYKVFFFGESSTQNTIAGYNNHRTKATIIFKANGSTPDTTLAHELLHGFRLAHTFANNEAAPEALYTYKGNTTNNLMDYTKKKEILYHWQWEIANRNVK